MVKKSGYPFIISRGVGETEDRSVSDFVVPVGVLLVMTVLLALTDADLRLAKLFYSLEKGWLWKDAQPWDFLYRYGTIPPIALSISGLVMAVYSFLSRKVIHWRKAGIFLALLMIIGPGLVVNTVFKDHWGRPRPAEVEMFGGKEKYLPVWERGIAGQDKSFPCGHASVGFFIFAPLFFLRKTSPKWAWIFLWIGTIYGVVMGIGRMVQGGHFATDVLWAGGMVYLTGLILSHLLRFDNT